jgi:hypothetical protein
MATQTKDELVEELSSQLTKNDLVELLGSKLKKDELASVLDADDDATKEQLVRRLASRTKDDLVQAVAGKLTKDEVQKAIESHSRRQEKDDDRDESNERDDDRQRTERGQRSERTQRDERRRPKPESDDELDWSAELDWSPPPRPTPAPVAFVGAAPFMPSQRVRVDLSGLPMMGVFAGSGTSAAGTIVGVDARARMVRVYLDAVFDGAKEIVVPPERVTPDR